MNAIREISDYYRDRLESIELPKKATKVNRPVFNLSDGDTKPIQQFEININKI